VSAGKEAEKLVDIRAVCIDAGGDRSVAATRRAVPARTIPREERQTMFLAAEKELTHLGETSGCADHDHDLVHELSRRLDSLWRYDQYMANAEWRDELRQFWQDAKAQEKQAIQRLKELIIQEVRNNCF
jgi:hypothetical protein